MLKECHKPLNGSQNSFQKAVEELGNKHLLLKIVLILVNVFQEFTSGGFSEIGRQTQLLLCCGFLSSHWKILDITIEKH